MMCKKFAPIILGFCGVIFAATAVVPAITQDPVTNQDEQQKEQEKARAELRKKAFDLLDQVIGDAGRLKLTENRVRVQYNAGDLIWDSDAERGRSLFVSAANGIAELIHSIDPEDRQYFNLMQVPSQLRQEMLPIVAKHDASLAYDLLNQTKLPPPPEDARGGRGGRGGGGPFAQMFGGQGNSEANLEANILAQVAMTDPKLALDNAKQLLSDDKYPSSLLKVLSDLEIKDEGRAEKLVDAMISRLRGDILTTSPDARNLAMGLLRPGPQPPGSSDSQQAQQPKAPPSQPLDEANFKTLLDAVVSAALNVTPVNVQALGRGAFQRGRPGGGRGAAPPPPGQSGDQPPTPEQINGTALLMSLQTLLPRIDQYFPVRSSQVRQKLSQIGVNSNNNNIMGRLGGPFGEFTSIVQQGTSDDVLKAAAQASPDIQPRLYQQAAVKAIREGDLDRAAQIASDKLSADQQKNIQQQIDRQRLMQAAIAGKTHERQQLMANLRSVSEKTALLSQLATAAAKQGDTKLAAQLLEEARSMIIGRAADYQQLEAPIRIAQAYSIIDPKVSFDVLGPGITQINELLPAAALLTGFEVRIFKDGELPIGGGEQLSNVISSYSQALSDLARVDFDGAHAAADLFQRPEPRIMARLSIVRGALTTPDPAANAATQNNGRNAGPRRPGNNQ